MGGETTKPPKAFFHILPASCHGKQEISKESDREEQQRANIWSKVT